MVLRLAKSTTIVLDLGDGDFLEVVEDVSKRDFNRLISLMPQTFDQDAGLTPVQGTQFQQALFEILVKGWSLDVEANVENYLGLDKNSAQALDEKLAEYFTSLTPDEKKDESPEKSRAKSPKGTTSTTA